MKKLLIIGISGTGKTHLAKILGERLKLPVIYLDSIFWKDNWQEATPKEVEKRIGNALSSEKWIIEGYILPLAKERLRLADTVLYLDYTGITTLRGGLTRWWQYKGRARPEMPKTNIEKFGISFLLMLLFRKERPEIENAIQGFEDKIIRLKSRKQTKKYLVNLNK